MKYQNFLLLISIFFSILLGLSVVKFSTIFAQINWQSADIVPDGFINRQDVIEALKFLGCPHSPTCPNAPTPTPVPGTWTSCGQTMFGTQLMSEASGLFIKHVSPYPSYVFTGNILMGVDMDPDTTTPSFGYPQLTGWQRGFGGGNLQHIINKHAAATTFNLENDYEYLVYGPESLHGAGEEALWPDIYVPEAEAIAHEDGKTLMYAPSRQDYEVYIKEARPDVNIPELIAQVAAHVDIWGFQLGFLQGQVDDNRMTVAEFDAQISQWYEWIKAGNPTTRLVTQIGIAKYDVATATCLPPESIEYILQWRERLAPYSDGIIVMPSQQCQPCPENPPAGFICTTNPEFIANYEQSFNNTVIAAQTVCQTEN